MTTYEAVIGLEIHIQIDTKSKAFCRCSTNYGDRQNTNICPVCTGQPGALPVLNSEFIKKAVLFSSAVNCNINLDSTFDRKNYFYPDMPKNYQITQFFKPVAEEGYLEITGSDGQPRKIGIERVHMEEDTGKSLHMGSRTLLNFNRAGLPLIEVVSRPDMKSGAEASEYFKKIYLIAVKYLGICKGNMEEGNLRCDANVSIRPLGSTELFTKAEVKNVNSFSFIQKAIDYEIERQITLVSGGGEVEAETRLWNVKLKQTETMRKKYGRNDYRYFNEPDLGPLRITEDFVKKIKSSLPELPDIRLKKLKEKYGLHAETLELFVNYPYVAAYFEEAAKHYPAGAQKISAWITGELLRLQDKEQIDTAVIKPQMLAELVMMLENKRLTPVQAKDILEIMHKEGKTASAIAEADPRFGKADEINIEDIVKQTLNENSEQLKKYLEGKESLAGFFVGQAVKKSKGMADPALVNEILKKELTNLKKNRE